MLDVHYNRVVALAVHRHGNVSLLVRAPLTLGVSWMLAIMGSVYVMTGRQIYRDMTKHWGNLFGMNFALEATTGLAMALQLGSNSAYYSHYVGDVFGVPLAIERLMAFFL